MDSALLYEATLLMEVSREVVVVSLFLKKRIHAMYIVSAALRIHCLYGTPPPPFLKTPVFFTLQSH